MDANDFSISETARKLKTSQPTLSNFLLGNSSISSKLVDKILVELGIDEVALLAFPPPLQADPLRTVPLVSHATAISAPLITQKVVVRTVTADVPFLEKLPSQCPARRREWMRFVAIELDQEQADFMKPLLLKPADIIIDRHYQKLNLLSNEERPIYALAERGSIRLGYIFVAGDHWTLRPPSIAAELYEVSFKGNPPHPPFIVGRVCKTDTYF